MPIISMFYGILISMRYYDNEQHNLPHIHVKYQDSKASISIVDGELLAGSLPKKQLRIVQAWVEIQRDSLLADWELAIEGEPLFKIDPIK